ncbi:RNA polymerase sigma-70 factor [Pararcticibacter amylolyticus]|nr:RNA polymerase sigma-70 factor [Pararcticibacter amylolyticus]
MPGKDPQLWTDVQLLELVKTDDLTAFEMLYNRYWSKLYLSAYNILRDQQASEDIVQEIMTDLWVKRSSSRIESLHSYLYASIRYKVFKVIRSGKIREGLFDEIEKLAVENEAERTLTEKDINKMLDQALSRLPEKCREIFLLSRKEHLSTKEIAERLGISPKTVESQITIALRRLRPVMGEVIFLAAFVFSSNFHG